MFPQHKQFLTQSELLAGVLVDRPATAADKRLCDLLGLELKPGEPLGLQPEHFAKVMQTSMEHIENVLRGRATLSTEHMEGLILITGNRQLEGRMMNAKVREAGFRLVNADCIVFAQRPKLSAFKDAIRQRIAALLDVEPECVGVKAKTGERVGPVGREEALMAEVVVLLEK